MKPLLAQVSVWESEDCCCLICRKIESATRSVLSDADYIASNACYEKIGYVLRGKLCAIG